MNSHGHALVLQQKIGGSQMIIQDVGGMDRRQGTHHSWQAVVSAAGRVKHCLCARTASMLSPAKGCRIRAKRGPSSSIVTGGGCRAHQGIAAWRIRAAIYWRCSLVEGI